MVYLFHALILVVSCIAIAKGADWLVESAARMAKKFGISELVIGLTVVAFGTSAPEFAVSVGQALQDKPEIALGNVIGSNVFNLGFILGGCAAVRAIITTPTMVYRDGGLLVAATAFIAIAMYDGALDRWEGIVMMCALVAYLLYLWKKRAPLDDEELPDEPASWIDPVLFVVGVTGVVGGAHFLVESAIFFAHEFGVSEWVISVTIVAAGTSLPEFATSMAAIIKGRYGISAGNLIGSDLFNLLGVLGLTAIIMPIRPSAAAYSSVLMSAWWWWW
ncbi:MAG: calcium/sodium antiporter [Planctomycetota bacterium]|jgi:cation:H+ antiporter